MPWRDAPADWRRDGIALWLLPRFGSLTQPRPQDSALQRRRQWLATIGVDLVAFTALHLLLSYGSLNFAALLVLPVFVRTRQAPVATAPLQPEPANA